VEGVAHHIAGLVEEARRGAGASFVIATDEGELLGRANLKKIDRSTGGAEIGYRIGERYTGRGIATQASAFLIGVARELQLRHVDAIVLDTNAASARVLEKSGFELVPGHTSRPGTRRFRFHLT
jgi:ribosomal-protein-alanine N-acetyltransferase